MNELDPDANAFARYSRQTRFRKIGVAGQARLAEGRVLILGMGALGSVTAEILTRAGVGSLRIVDRDYVDLSNLQRQSLYDEQDVRSGLPKVIAARNKLQMINSTISVEPVVCDVTPVTIASVCDEVDLVLDGSDNFEIRFLLNDYCVHRKLPWIYAGCLGSDGQCMVVQPGHTACLRCLMPDGPPTQVATCDSMGVLAPIIHVISAIQALEALKFLTGNFEELLKGLTAISMWEGRQRLIPTLPLFQSQQCPACWQGQYDWLFGSRFSQTTRLCGRNSVQITPAETRLVNLAEWDCRSAVPGSVVRNEYLLRFRIENFQITLFADGRAIIEGTEDLSVARVVYARLFGT